MKREQLQFLRTCLLCIFMPFFYGAATRVPMIYIGVHSHFVLDVSWVGTGLILGCYQMFRTVANLSIPMFGVHFGHWMGTCNSLHGECM